MIALQKIFGFILLLNGIGIVIFFNMSMHEKTSIAQIRLEMTQELNAKDASPTSLRTSAQDSSMPRFSSAPLNVNTKGLSAYRQKHRYTPVDPLVDPNSDVKKFTRKTNPFVKLGAYPTSTIPIAYTDKVEKTHYEKVNYGFINDENYCERVDYYNLANPHNIFERQNFFSDYANDTVPRRTVMKGIGRDIMNWFSKYGSTVPTDKARYHFDITINSFFMNMDGFHKFHKIGKNFLCAGQMYNRIPGQRALIRKDDLVESIDRYAAKFEKNPHCFNKQMFFPYSFRLYLKDECDTFFTMLNSDEYKESLKTEPIQYIIKVGHGSHSADGVFILDSNQTSWLNIEYKRGRRCGEETRPLLAQKYVTNPLLLDLNNKFDFRVYMLIASTNPLIVYYHDGFLRASLSTYDKFSGERGKHLTNTHLAESIFSKAKQEKINGMTEQELRDYHIWSFEELQEYLLEIGKTNDPQWLENTLKPQFKKAMIHLVKMSSTFFWKGSNVYGLYGLDFMLDENFNLWFIEGNPNPQLIATSKFLGDLLNKLLRSLFEIEYGLYRSRMTRVLKVVQKLQQQEAKGTANYEKLQAEYQKANSNKFEPQYQTSKLNTFTLVMDESLPAKEAYGGYLKSECIVN